MKGGLNRPFLMEYQILNIAHRGASEYLPDNTIESFDRALVEKADMIELDVRKTADGELVLFHDWYVRTEPRSLPDLSIPTPISHIRFEDLQDHCEIEGYRLATLKEVLERYNDRIDINIELKAGGYEREVIDLVNKFDLADQVVLSSFFPWVLKKIKDIDAGIKAGWIIGQEQVVLLNRLGRLFVYLLFKITEADSAHLHYEMVTPNVVKHFHARQIPIYTWTVNRTDVMKRLIEMGVDGIITDRPAVLNSILKQEIDSRMAIEFSGAKLATSGEKA